MVHGVDEIAYAAKQQERITIAFLALAWLFIFLRIWTRTQLISNFGWDDATMILAGMIFAVYSGAQLFIEANGGGTHVTSFESLVKLSKWAIVCEVTYLVVMATVKISLGIFFARILVASWHLTLIYVAVGVNLVSSVAAFFYCIFRCGSNVDRYVLSQLQKKCTPSVLDRFMAYQSATFTTLTDLVFVVLPIIVLWNANMDRKSKLSVGFILCLAASACICSMIRFQYVEGLTQIDDFFWNASNVAIWSTIESGTSIIAGCLATLRPLLRRIFAKAGSITKSLRSSNSPSSSRHTNNSANERNPGALTTDKSNFSEFMVEPGDVIELASDSGRERESQDPILQQQRDPNHDFPWPARVIEDRREQVHTARMHTQHKSWMLRRAGRDDGGEPYRPSSAPPALGMFKIERRYT